MKPRFLISSASLAMAAAVSGLAQSAPDRQETITLSEFVVDSTTDRGYVATNVISASRIPLPLRDLPLTITVLTEQFLEDFNTLDLNDALRYANGARKAFETETAYYLRGQRVNYQLRNGFARYDFTPAVNIQRVEVVKGPAAILYGLTFPGGVMNYVTKQPLFRNFEELGVQFGSYDFLRGTLDVNRTFSDSVAVRVIASRHEGGSFTKDDPNEMETFAPSLIFRPTERTVISLDYEYAKRRDNQFPFARPYSVFAGSNRVRYPLDVLPADASAGPDGAKVQYSRAFTAAIEQKLGRAFTLRLLYNYSWREETEIKHDLFLVPPTTRLSTGQIYVNNFRNWDENYQAEIVGTVETGPVSHRLLAGVQHFDRLFLRRQRTARPEFVRPANLLNLPPVPSTSFYNDSVYTPINYTGASMAKLPGYYVIDTMSLMRDRLFVLAGARYSEIKQSNPRTGTRDLSQDRWSPQLGVNFRALDAVSVYGLFSESLQPNGSNTNPVGWGPQGAFDPQLGEGFDLGVKFSVLGDRVSGSLAYFEVARTNVPQNDPVLTSQFRAATGLGGNVRILSGEETTKGFEMDLAVSPTPNWQIVLGYQYVGFAEVTGDANPARLGLELTGVAPHEVRLYTRYEFPRGDLKGLSLGAGFTYVDDQIPQGLFLPAMTQTDVFARYRTRILDRDTEFTLNVYNLFDEVNETQYGVYAQPLRLQAGISVRF